MGDQTVHQQLQAQLLEQSEAIESLAALLAAEPNAEIQQVVEAAFYSQQCSNCWSCIQLLHQFLLLWFS